MLHDAGYLHYSDSDHIYTLSLKLFRISHRFAPVHNLTKLAMPIMQRVCHQTAQSCHLVVYSMGGGLILAQQHAEDASNRLVLPVGGSGPLLDNCAGHVLLSFSSPDRRARMLQEQARYPEREVDHSKKPRSLHARADAGPGVERDFPATGLRGIMFNIALGGKPRSLHARADAGPGVERDFPATGLRGIMFNIALGDACEMGRVTARVGTAGPKELR